MRKGKGNFHREVRKAERAQKMPPYQISGPRSVAGRYQSCSKTGWEKCFSFENNMFFSSFLLWTILAGSLKISVWGGRKLAWKISPPKINAWWSINQLRERLLRGTDRHPWNVEHPSPPARLRLEGTSPLSPIHSFSSQLLWMQNIFVMSFWVKGGRWEDGSI